MSVQRSRLGRAGLRILAEEAGLIPEIIRSTYMTRSRRIGLVHMAVGLERVGKSAQAAGLRDKVVDMERESLRRRVTRVNRTEKRKHEKMDSDSVSYGGRVHTRFLHG